MQTMKTLGHRISVSEAIIILQKQRFLGFFASFKSNVSLMFPKRFHNEKGLNYSGFYIFKCQGQNILVFLKNVIIACAFRGRHKAQNWSVLCMLSYFSSSFKPISSLKKLIYRDKICILHYINHLSRCYSSIPVRLLSFVIIVSLVIDTCLSWGPDFRAGFPCVLSQQQQRGILQEVCDSQWSWKRVILFQGECQW